MRSLLLVVLCGLGALQPPPTAAADCDSAALSQCATPSGSGAAFCAAFSPYWVCAVAAGCATDQVAQAFLYSASQQGCMIPGSTQPVVAASNGTIVLSAPAGDVVFQLAGQMSTSVTSVLGSIAAAVQQTVSVGLQASAATGTATAALSTLVGVQTSAVLATASGMVAQLRSTLLANEASIGQAASAQAQGVQLAAQATSQTQVSTAVNTLQLAAAAQAASAAVTQGQLSMGIAAAQLSTSALAGSTSNVQGQLSTSIGQTRSTASFLSAAIQATASVAGAQAGSVAVLALGAASSTGAAANSYTDSQIGSLQATLLSLVAQTGLAASGNITQLRADASNGVAAAVTNLNNTVVQPLSQSTTQQFSSAASSLQSVNATQNTLSRSLQQVISCAVQGQAFNGVACVFPPARDVSLLTTQPCSAARNGILTFNSATNTLTICTNSTPSSSLTLVPALLGTRQNPASSCGDILTTGQPDGSYFVGSPFRQVYCRGGQLSFLPPFNVLGNPFAYFPYDSDMQDVMGRVYTLRTGTPTFSPFSRVINAVSLDGTGAAFAQVNIDQNLWQNPWTVTVWVFIRTLNKGASTDNAILGHFTPPTSAANTALHLGERGNSPYFGFWGNDLTPAVAQFQANTWYHVAFSYDGVATKTIYVNGVSVAQGTGARYTGVNSVTQIGRYPWDTVGTSGFNGLIDDLIIYSKLLTPVQVAQLANSYRGLVIDSIRSCADIQTNKWPDGYYSFQPQTAAVPINVNCTAGTAAYFAPVNALMPLNYFAFNNNLMDAMLTTAFSLTPMGAAISFPSARNSNQGQCVTLDGATNYLIYPIYSQYVFQYAFTIAAWVNFVAVNRGSGSSADNAILGSGTAVNNRGLHLGERGGTLFFGFYGNDIASAPVLTANVWTHVAAVYTGTGCGRVLYINGQQVASGCGAGPAAGGAFVGTGAATWIGGYPMFSGFMRGSIDELMVFPSALQPNDVTLLFSQA